MTAIGALPGSVILRERTAAAHSAIDGIYARFDLSDRDSYIAFLTAHARVLFPIERLLAASPTLPPFEPRTPALAADLGRLNTPCPPHAELDIATDDAATWGLFYVVEGSRLGGVMLARGVGADLPSGYLNAGHGRGGWRAVRTAIDEAHSAADPTWMDRAVDAANRCFGWYGAAAA